MENTLKISPSLSGLPTIDYRTLNDFQGDFKTLSEVEYTKLKLNLFGDGVIPQNEFFVPLMVWIEPKSKKPYILDGHQRINVIKSLNGTPYELPYIEIAAKNKNEAKKKLALVNSQYGKITRDGWDSFMHDVDKDWVRGMTTLEAFTLPPLEGFGKDFEPSSKQSGEGAYSEEIDYSILNDFDGSDGLDARLDEMDGGVKKAIQIEFDPEHYEEAYQLIKFWREQKMYIGAFLVEKLKDEKIKILT